MNKFLLTLFFLINCLSSASSQEHYEWAFDCRYDNCYDFYDGRAIITSKRLKGFIDLTGRTRVKPRYHIIDAYSQNLASAGFIDFGDMNSRSGYLNKGGNMVIDTRFSITSPFNEGLACVKIGEQWGYINLAGEMVIPAKYEAAQTFFEGVAGVKYNGKWGFINKQGKFVIAPRFQMVLHFQEGLSAVKYNDKWGFIDHNGLITITPQYSYASSFHEGLARIKTDNKWGLIQANGQFFIAPDYQMIYQYFGGRARVQLNDRWGYLDRQGNLAIPAEFADASDFSEKLARVKKGDKWGFIKRNGQLVIPAVFSDAYDFREGLARVTLNGQKGYIRYREPLDTDMVASQADAAPQLTTSRKIKEGKYLKVNSPDITVKVYDHKKIDGDIISLNYNGEWILHNHQLSAEPHPIQLKMDPASQQNYLMLYAVNLGKEPPNTVAVAIDDGQNTQTIILDSDLDSCDIIFFDLP